MGRYATFFSWIFDEREGKKEQRKAYLISLLHPNLESWHLSRGCNGEEKDLYSFDVSSTLAFGGRMKMVVTGQSCIPYLVPSLQLPILPNEGLYINSLPMFYQ